MFLRKCKSVVVGSESKSKFKQLDIHRTEADEGSSLKRSNRRETAVADAKYKVVHIAILLFWIIIVIFSFILYPTHGSAYAAMGYLAY